jgi:hypothetical protein
MRAWLVVLLWGALLCGCLALGKASHASTRPPTAGQLGPIAQ